MLTYKQFIDEHKEKYKGLSREEKRKRYEDYLSSTKAQVVASLPKASKLDRGITRTLKDFSREQMRENSYKLNDHREYRGVTNENHYPTEVRDYLHCLIDPVNAPPAKQPSLSGLPSIPVKIEVPFVVKTNSHGAFGIQIQDNPDRFYRNSWDPFNNTVPAVTQQFLVENIGGEIYYGANRYGNFPAVADISWQSSPETSAFRKVFAGFRTVAMSLNLDYSAAPLNASGRICMGLFNPSVPFPEFQGAAPAIGTAQTFQQWAEYQMMETGPAIDGGAVHWRPMGVNVTEFKRTISVDGASSPFYTYSEIVPGQRQLAYLGDQGAYAATVYRSLQDNVGDGDSPFIIAIGEGLPVNTVVFSGTITWVVEAVADERTMNFVQGATPTNVRDINAVAKTAGILANVSPTTMSTGDRIKGYSKKVSNAAKSAESAWASVKSTGSKIWSGLNTALDVAGIIAAMF